MGGAPWRWSRSKSVRSGSSTASNDVMMEEVPRGSTETQRRNGFKQSHAKDRGVAITEDITNGNYLCSICTEPVVTGNTREYSMWHCTQCYNVFHFRCVKAWADASGTMGVLGYKSWKCPYCQHLYEKIPSASCWCGKESFDLNVAPAGKPNACLKTCERSGVCKHGNASLCSKKCHPGPCTWNCTAICNQLPPRPIKPPGMVSRFRKRFKERPKGKLPGVIAMFMMICAVYTAIWFFVAHHIRWWAHPYEFPNFIKSSAAGWEVAMLIILGIFIIWPLLGVLLFSFSTEFGALVAHLLNLDTPTTKKTRKGCITLVMYGFLLVVGMGLWIGPWVGFCGGADIEWFYQMRNSCNGLNTRILMDSVTNPRYKFTFQSLTKSVKDTTFYLANHLEPEPNTNNPFQYYQRLSGSTSTTPNIAIDIDMQHNLWRMMSLNDTDVANNWTANAAKISGYAPGTKILQLPVVPMFKPINETIIRNGTFTDVTNAARHMHIPELGLSIANMYMFYQKCSFEPFMRVFNTSGLQGDAKGMASLLDSKWQGQYDDKVVMRTASFGHGRQKLSMCGKEGNAIDLGAQSVPVKEGMQDEMLVPFALMAAVRMRINETDYRSLDC
ncbi:hypothetical protein BGZ60DRAFT_524798 [Tricladium varicosporioides]|nr:hypothetical protein BGZ60DRAFT_524798 [Hymenoscyphus varicosporioides]